MLNRKLMHFSHRGLEKEYPLKYKNDVAHSMLGIRPQHHVMRLEKTIVKAIKKVFQTTVKIANITI